MNFHTAATFCWWLTLREEIPARDQVYRPRESGGWMVSDNKNGLHGFRLLTEDEFEAAVRAGTRTISYHGDLREMLDRYAWHSPTSGLRTHPVANLKPNDAGLFDMLGNAGELYEWPQRPRRPEFTASFGGGFAEMVDLTQTLGAPIYDTQPTKSLPFIGFRVARTIDPRP